MDVSHKKSGFFQITPFIVFVSLFLVSTISKSHAISPLFSCIIAIIYSFFTFIKPLSFNKKVELFVEGGTDKTVLSMIYIFIFSAVFTHVLKLIGGIESAVNIGLYLLPSSFLLPGFFTIIGLFATAIGSSMGTIAAFLPVGIGLASTLGVNPALMAGVVVSGAMLGDNLSIISDTTIAATQTTGSSMKGKFKENIWFVIPAFVLTFATLWLVNSWTLSAGAATPMIILSTIDFIKVFPYLLIFVLAILGIDVIAVLVIGILLTIGIGGYFGTFSFIEGTQVFLAGFTTDSDIHMTLILSLLVAGLSHIVTYNGGLDYLLDRCSKNIKSSRGAQCAIAILIFLVNAAVAINTVAILIVGPAAKKIATSFGVSPDRTAVLLDMFSCFCQGILPYAPQLLLAGALANVSSIAIMPYLYYQWFIFIVALFGILMFRSKSEDKQI